MWLLACIKENFRKVLQAIFCIQTHFQGEKIATQTLHANTW